MLPLPVILAIISALTAAGTGIAGAVQKSKDRKAAQKGGLPQGALQIPKFSQPQMQGLQQLLQMGLGGLQQTPFNFAPIKQNAINSFYQDIIPSIQERYAGTSSASSGLGGEIGGAGQRLAQGLAAQEQGYNLQNRNQLLQLLGMGLQSPYETIYKGRQPGFVENASVAALPALLQNLPELSNQWSEYWNPAAQTGVK